MSVAPCLPAGYADLSPALLWEGCMEVLIRWVYSPDRDSSLLKPPCAAMKGKCRNSEDADKMGVFGVLGNPFFLADKDKNKLSTHEILRSSSPLRLFEVFHPFSGSF